MAPAIEPPSTALAYVYLPIDPLTQSVRYVGTTIRGMQERYADHLNPRHRPPTLKERWVTDLWRRGAVPQLRIVAAVPADLRFLAERAWAAQAIAQGARLLRGVPGTDRAPVQRARHECMITLRAELDSRTETLDANQG